MRENIDPPERLYLDILERIKREKKRTARIRFVLSGTAAIVSAIALVPACFYVSKEFYQSEFYQYLSATFSDFGIALFYWKEFSLSLAESLPLSGPAIFLSLVFIFMGALKLATKNAETALLPLSTKST